MTRYRVLFMGSPSFAVASLEALLQKPELFEIVGVVTQPSKPAGRGQKLTPSAVAQAALKRGLNVLELLKIKTSETRELLAALRPDVAVVAAYGRILPPQLLQLPKHGCVNVHASLLPRHRGASPINHSILAGDHETGVTIMRMDEGLDTGPYFAMRKTAILPDDTTGTLTERLAVLGAELLAQTLEKICNGELNAQMQDQAHATYAPLLQKEQGFLDFHKSARHLERQIRAFQPWPMAYLNRGSERIQVLHSHVVEDRNGPPFKVLQADKEGVVVGCGELALCLDAIKPAGKKAMPAAAWVAGRGVQTGDIFDEQTLSVEGAT